MGGSGSGSVTCASLFLPSLRPSMWKYEYKCEHVCVKPADATEERHPGRHFDLPVPEICLDFQHQEWLVRKIGGRDAAWKKYTKRGKGHTEADR